MRILLLLFLFPTALSADHFRLYHIGASLTWDSSPGLVREVLEINGHTVDQGYNITCGKSLTHILANPEDTCVPVPQPYGWWPEALANYDWDVVTFQMFAGQGSTGQSELAALSTMIQELTKGGRNTSCRIFVFVGWPQIGTDTYSEIYNTPYDDPTQPPPRVAAFLDYLYIGIKELHPLLDIRTLPTGRVLDILDQKLREEPIEGFTNAYDFYRDNTHINGEGRHLAVLSLLTAILEKDVRTLSFVPYSTMPPNPLRTFVREVIWYTFTEDHRTKVLWEPYGRIDKNQLNFTGTLQRSSNLQTWTILEDATSPHNLTAETPPVFFRSTR